MLTKLEKQVLDICNNKLNPNELISSLKIEPYLSDIAPVDLYRCCKSLNSNGYFDHFSVGISGECLMALSHQGRHYKEISRIKVKSFLLRSVLVPIVVSCITTLITLLVRALL